jgi:hypothetical protein
MRHGGSSEGNRSSASVSPFHLQQGNGEIRGEANGEASGEERALVPYTPASNAVARGWGRDRACEVISRWFAFAAKEAMSLESVHVWHSL